MDYYINFTVLPDLEFTTPMLINNLFTKLHRQIGARGEKQVGVSFPQVTNANLGKTVRLHGTHERLEAIMSDNWMRGLRDYVTQSSISTVPKTTSLYRTVKRVQKKSAHNKRKRSVAKGWLTEEAAMQEIPEKSCDMLTLPYIQIRSLSTKSVMRLYVSHGDLQQTPITGNFSSFGFSATATVPWF